MRRIATILIGLIVVGSLLGFMSTFQVRYDQVAVLTTFDRAESPDPDAPAGTNSGSVYRQAGLYLKAPWPVQNVATFPKKLQVLEDQLEEMQTADDFSVIVKTYLIWQIDDPIAFFRSLKNVETAQKQLLPLMNSLKGVISTYRFDQLVNTNPDALKLDEIEQQCTRYLSDQLSSSGADFGIKVQQVGIRRLVLPEQITAKVFERMRSTREQMAAKARNEGEAEAATIRAEAQSARDRIMAFARRRAAEIEARGEAEAARYYPVFKEDEDFAIYLKQIDVLKNTLGNYTTFILNADDLDLMRLLLRGPEAPEGE